MSAMQRSLEWSPPALILLNFAQMWSTADPVTNLTLTVRLQGTAPQQPAETCVLGRL